MRKGIPIEQVELLREWYKPTPKGAKARKLLAEHPELFEKWA